MLSLNLASSDGQDIDMLQERIEHLAYSGFEDHLFSSVMSVVPEPYLPAVATLEAVRRGADLRGSGGTRAEVARRLGEEGESEKRRSFIKFSEALSLFVQQQTMFTRISKFFRHEQERGVFHDAIQLHETHGAILLTAVDEGGGGQEELAAGTGVATYEGNLVIHVNPSQFADAVRRVVDVRWAELQ